MKQEWKVISEKTLIPIGALSVIVGAVMWLTSVWKQGDANAAQIQDIKATQQHENDRIYDKLDKMDAKIDHLLDKK